MKRIPPAILAVLAMLVSLASTPAFASVAFTAQSNAMQCTPKQVPFRGYSRWVQITDSIGQKSHSPGTVPITAAYNPSRSIGVTTTSSSAIVTYNDGDAAALGLYLNQAISGTGIASGSLVLGAVDATHILLSQNATASGTITATLGNPATTANAFQTMFRGGATGGGELTALQASTPFFRFDQWNDHTRNWGALGNTAAMMRGANMGFSGANTIDLRLHDIDDVKALNPDGVFVAVGVNNITSPTFQADLAGLVDTLHAWCPSMPIILGNIRATGTGSGTPAARPTGGIVYDNQLIAAIGAARSWLTIVDLFTATANNAASGGSLTIAGAATTSGVTTVTAALNGAGDLRQTGVQIGQAVTGSNIPASTTVTAVSGGTITLSNAPTSTATVNLTFSPMYGVGGASQVASDQNFNTGYPSTTIVADYLHPGAYGAWQTVPALRTAICGFIANGCAASTTSNIFLDNPGASMLTTAPASLLTGTTQAVNHGYTGSPAAVSPTGTWNSGDTSMTVSSATGITRGMLVTATGVPANSYVTAVSGTTISWTSGNAATQAGSSASVQFAPAISGTAAAGMDAITTAAGYSSYVVATAANAETGGNMMTFTLYPNGTSAKETLYIQPGPTVTTINGTATASRWRQLWGEFEVDQNPGWVTITALDKERNSAYSNLYLSQGIFPIMPQGSGTRRVWAHSECFPMPANDTGSTPQFAIQWAPLTATGTPTITLRRWDIRECRPPQSLYKTSANDNAAQRVAS